MSTKIENLKISIIGLGLIGGSLARAFVERLHIRDITAVDPNRESIGLAVKDGTICRGFTDINQYVYDSDMVFICTPVKRALEYLDILAGKVKADCIITDVGSTKSGICKHMNNMKNAPCFVGGHPMAGAEKSGYASGISHIFENAYYILTPCKFTSQSSLELMTDIIKGIGAIPLTMDAEEHDRIAGSISHVPHIIASALVNMVEETDTPDGKMRLLAAGGFKDITRIASSSPEMWENIVASNKDKISAVLGEYIEILNRYRGYIDSSEWSQVFHFFKTSKDFRDSFSSTRNGLIAPLHEIIVDVIDKPGIIGEIATLLGSRGINIKNINVSNSREFEQGCLRITLPDGDSADTSFSLLAENGYKVYKK